MRTSKYELANLWFQAKPTDYMYMLFVITVCDFKLSSVKQRSYKYTLHEFTRDPNCIQYTAKIMK